MELLKTVIEITFCLFIAFCIFHIIASLFEDDNKGSKLT